MKLTPFGFVTRSEELFKEALSLPPVGGGEWSTRRATNLVSHTGSLQILIKQQAGPEKTALVLHSRLTGGSRDGSIQGWVEYPGETDREAFVLRESDADRAMEEIFDIVERVLARVPEWDRSALPPRPEPPPRKFEPLIPDIPKTEAVAVSEEPAFDPQALVDAMLSPDSFEKPAEAPAAQEDAPFNSQAMVDAMLSPASLDEAPSGEQPPAAEAPSSESEEKPGKKPAKAKKPKA